MVIGSINRISVDYIDMTYIPKWLSSVVTNFFGPMIFQFLTQVIEHCGYGKMRQMSPKKGCLIINKYLIFRRRIYKFKEF